MIRLGGGEGGTVPAAREGGGVHVHVLRLRDRLRDRDLRLRDRLRSATLHAHRGRLVRASPRPRVAALPPPVQRLPSRRGPAVRRLTLGVPWLGLGLGLVLGLGLGFGLG